GSHVRVIEGVEGTLFLVWAPSAARVSVVGTFNHWDGRLHMMEKIQDTGIFELFIPGITAGTEYNYEVKYRNGKTVVKLDPYAMSTTPDFTSVVCEDMEYDWGDFAWLENRAEKQNTDKPMSIYEVSLEAWAGSMGMKGSNYRNLAESICDYVKTTGYTLIELMPVAEYIRSDMMGYGSAAYFSPTGRFGNGEDFKAFVEIFHKAGIGIIMDWNGAYFGDDSLGLIDFDGTSLYGSLKPSLEKYPDWEVTTFAYEKPEVRSFLFSSLNLWIEKYHIDGVRIDGVASMLYLDYGKSAGQWQPNMYGEPENLEAESFIREMCRYIHKNFNGVILIAEESSGWAGVTTSGGDLPEDKCLGFDYKWDYNWKNDFLSFINKDPLFRKGDYGKLTYPMLYHYNEAYIMELSHDEFAKDKVSFLQMVSGEELADRLSDLRAAYGFLFTHPGRKLLCMGQDIGMPDNWSLSGAIDMEKLKKSEYQKMITYIRDLNSLYKENPAFYEQDDLSDGFEWLDSISADETVIAYLRRDDKKRELTVVVNFTPVRRKGYVLGVASPGKYKEIFNSDNVLYGGQSKINSEINFSDDKSASGRENSITIDLPASSMVVYEYEPFSDIEVMEMAIRRQARIAKEKAEREAEIARRLKEEAKREAELAIEAEHRAKKAAQAAVKAQEEADKKAAAAVKASRRIDAETKKKLEELYESGIYAGNTGREGNK
ncbi:MAG: 1,4-alpha-glucan branching protein GlgB, partial [Eubacteriales bacterium]|nr:1,4-alpha-glucan branching protein GlgB [Eubacteriales bacterium]